MSPVDTVPEWLAWLAITHPTATTVLAFIGLVVCAAVVVAEAVMVGRRTS